MRVLVVGAGLGGLTLAALLRGADVEVVERAPALRPDGFGLLLYPFGMRALAGLPCHDALLAGGCALSVMSLRDGHGRPLEDYPLDALTERAGPLVCLRRPLLMEALAGAVGDRVRWRLALGDDGATHVPGHEMFVWWGPPELCAPDRVVEWWAPGCMVAVFPVPGAVQCSVLVPAAEGEPRQRVLAALDGVGGTTLDGVRASLADAGTLYPWALADVRAARWTDGGRVALLGDAAVGSLPTAGIGASAAMLAAGVLAEELSGTDADGVPAALARYVARVRRVAERHQRESRRFGRLMMIDSHAGAAVRDVVLRHVSASHVLSGVIASIGEPA